VLTIIDRYVLRQVAKPLATAMAIGLLMLLAERLVRLLDTTLGKKNPSVWS
jgi:lipopolysaccharide export system permease protein